MKHMQKICIILLSGTLLIGLLFGLIGKITGAYFNDPESSDNNALTIASSWDIVLLGDGFENVPWDALWDGNGTTSWTQKTLPYTDSYSTECVKTSNGYLTTDDLDASGATSITVSFWFKTKKLIAGDIMVQLFDGSSYNNLYDIISYPTHVSRSWCYFSEVITDPSYFVSNFRLRFDGSALAGGASQFLLDDVLITKAQ